MLKILMEKVDNVPVQIGTFNEEMETLREKNTGIKLFLHLWSWAMSPRLSWKQSFPWLIDQVWTGFGTDSHPFVFWWDFCPDPSVDTCFNLQETPSRKSHSVL